MKFALAQMLGIVGDQLTWWGEALQDRSARMTCEVVGITETDTDAQALTKVLAYVYPESPDLSTSTGDTDDG